MRQGSNPRRPRGRGQRNKPHYNPRNQTYDSNGPDIRVRGNAYQVLEKYLALARDANAAGDRIAAENFLQHAEHYFRLINQFNGDDPNRNNRPLQRPDVQVMDGGEQDGTEPGEPENGANGGTPHGGGIPGTNGGGRED
jgi:Domain of unknown function (DUF4167)